MAKIRLEQFQTVSSNGRAILTTDRIWPNTLEYIVLRLGDTGVGVQPPQKSEITRILVRLGSKPIWDVTGDQLRSMCLYEGRPDTQTIFVLPWAQPRAKTVEAQYLGAIDFGAVGVRQMTLEISIVGGTNPTLDAWAEVAPPKLLTPAQNIMFRALLRTPIAPSAAVTFAPFLINYGQAGGALLRRMHFFSNIVTAAEVKRDGLDIYEQITLDVNNGFLDELSHDPQPNVFTLDFVEDDNESKSLTTIRNDKSGGSLIPQQILITTSGSGALDVVSDVYATYNGL